jgi:hypothetical protein
MGEINRVREIARTKKIDPFPLRPPGKAFGFHLTATGRANARVNMQIGNDAHGDTFPLI